MLCIWRRKKYLKLPGGPIVPPQEEADLAGQQHGGDIFSFLKNLKISANTASSCKKRNSLRQPGSPGVRIIALGASVTHLTGFCSFDPCRSGSYNFDHHCQYPR